MHITKKSNNVKSVNVEHNFFKNSNFSKIQEWNKLNLKIRNSATLETFKKQILDFIRPKLNSTFKLHNPFGVKLLTRLEAGLFHDGDRYHIGTCPLIYRA